MSFSSMVEISGRWGEAAEETVQTHRIIIGAIRSFFTGLKFSFTFPLIILT